MDRVQFGPASRVTAVRAVLSVGVAGLTLRGLGEPLSGRLTALLVAVSAVALALDAVDGYVARRTGTSSAFGARFDMETDAAFTLVLCALVLQAGQAGPWVLASGLMRYAFVAASRPWPWLAGALPPSKRRQTVCVVQITALIICLGPIVPTGLAASLAAFSLALLTLSFSIDVRTLARQRPTSTET